MPPRMAMLTTVTAPARTRPASETIARRGRPPSRSNMCRHKVANHQMRKIAARRPRKAPALIAPWLSAKNELILAVDASGAGGDPANNVPTSASTMNTGPPMSAYFCHLLSLTTNPPFFKCHPFRPALTRDRYKNLSGMGLYGLDRHQRVQLE